MARPARPRRTTPSHSNVHDPKTVTDPGGHKPHPGRVKAGTLNEGGVVTRIYTGSLENLTTFDPYFRTNVYGRVIHHPRAPRAPRQPRKR